MTDTLEALEALVKQHGLPGDPNAIADSVLKLPDTSTGWYVGAAITLAAEVKRLREALEKIADQLICSKHLGGDAAHYCPNCDTSLYDPRSIAREALEPRS